MRAFESFMVPVVVTEGRVRDERSMPAKSIQVINDTQEYTHVSSWTRTGAQASSDGMKWTKQTAGGRIDTVTVA
jgi:hypothetical protein